jgi:hypothetical protein
MGDRCGASKNGSKAKAGLEASTLPIMKARVEITKRQDSRNGAKRDRWAARNLRGIDDCYTQNHFCINRLFCSIFINCIRREL